MYVYIYITEDYIINQKPLLESYKRERERREDHRAVARLFSSTTFFVPRRRASSPDARFKTCHATKKKIASHCSILDRATFHECTRVWWIRQLRNWQIPWIGRVRYTYLCARACEHALRVRVYRTDIISDGRLVDRYVTRRGASHAYAYVCPSTHRT